jgi:2-polyprenyl-6-methoxyphenol hydroxylase-like FAD-dependent oxidoreductase
MDHKGEIMWVATHSSGAPSSTCGDVEWTQMNNKHQLQNILKRCPKLHPIHECVAATDPQRLLDFGLYYRQHRSDGGHRGRICLMGDSCHATIPFVGQETNIAIEGVVSLAAYIEKKNNFRMEPAFQQYCEQRFKQTKRAVNRHDI